MSGNATEQPAFEDLQQAADWFAVLQDDRVTDADRRQWQRWLETGPRQRAAWQQVETVASELSGMASPMVRQVLEVRPAVSRRRRTVLRTLMLAPAAGLAGWVAARHAPWQEWTAAYRTETGEQRAWTLADGSQLLLNTATAVDVDYSVTLRRIVLHRGELLITSGYDESRPPRPLVVDVAAGRLTALGTRFAVRHEEDGAARVAVFDGAVQVSPADEAEPRVLQAGQQVRLRSGGIDAASDAAGYGLDWQQGMLVADGMRLGDFIAELGRYRRGHLACAPEVADLRIVGAYPLADTSRVLAALQATLPVQVRQPLPWWTVVEARPALR
ncbi:FecR family protein [Paracidovorax valerianellae]|uniref:FecR family protein n=1 Tax=Paracidovorax valerianellae TaxID=187868 RepID=A0A1G6XP81_9BURK|nr:FecR domain-containing protein [Paracidovorax valerianellae]SDD79177.1 FecR family protein [Paracidovorax valerianellae]